MSGMKPEEIEIEIIAFDRSVSNQQSANKYLYLHFTADKINSLYFTFFEMISIDDGFSKNPVVI